MSKIPRAFIDELLERIDIVTLIESYVKLKKQGRNFVACCPFHNEKTPSFSVSAEKQMFYCFGCGAGGNALSFLMDYERLHFVEAVEDLARRLGIAVPRTQSQEQTTPDISDHEALALAATFYQTQLKKHPKAQEAVHYLKSRGVSGKTAKHFGLGFSPPGWNNLLNSTHSPEIRSSWNKTGLIITNQQAKTYDRFRHRIMFPIRNRRGQVVGFGGRTIDPNDKPKYLNSAESSVFHKSQTLYGLYELTQQQRRSDVILIVEGYMDVIMLAEHGISNAVATLGTATTPDHIQILLRLTKKIIFCFDGDKAGRAAAWRALTAGLSKLRDDTEVRFLFLPDDEDPDSLVRKIGRTAFLQRLKQALGLPEYFIQHLSNEYDQHSMSGKSALLKQASQLLATLPNINLKTVIIDELAKLLHLPAERLPRLMRNSATTTSSPNDKLSQIPTNFRTALALLIQHPPLIEAVPANLSLASNEVSELWHELVHYLGQQPSATPANVVEYWREKSQYDLVLALAHWQHPIPDAGIKPEFEALMAHLQKLDQSRELNNLLQQAKNQELSQDERQRLLALIRQKQLLSDEKPN
jgi:DNA primase